ncbi:MAG: T9SS type A sorting domain-containing protein, partial [Bacteroidota bacterium]
AADINNSGDITTFDLVELRKLILQIEETFNNNTSWRFVPNDYVFPDATNPFQETFPEAYTIDTLSENMEATFVAIKTGDVDCSAQLHSDQSDNRHTWNPYVLPVKDRQLTAGETFTLDLQIPATQNLIGFQFALDYHTHLLAFDGLGETSLPQFGKGNWLNKANGQLNLSWNVAKAQVLREGQSLVQIQFTALKDTWLSDAIQIADQSDLQAEVYRQDEDQITLLQPKLQFNANPTQTQNLDWQLYQNQPNPFEQSTLIPFSLSSPQNIRLQVFDAQGRILFEKQGQYDAGMHQIEVSQDQLQAKGLLLYALTVEGSVSTYRMLSID